MRSYVRTGKNTGVSFGCLGTLLVLPVYVVWLFLVASFYLGVLIIIGLLYVGVALGIFSHWLAHRDKEYWDRYHAEHPRDEWPTVRMMKWMNSRRHKASCLKRG